MTGALFVFFLLGTLSMLAFVVLVRLDDEK